MEGCKTSQASSHTTQKIKQKKMFLNIIHKILSQRKTLKYTKRNTLLSKLYLNKRSFCIIVQVFLSR